MSCRKDALGQFEESRGRSCRHSAGAAQGNEGRFRFERDGVNLIGRGKFDSLLEGGSCRVEAAEAFQSLTQKEQVMGLEPRAHGGATKLQRVTVEGGFHS